MKLHFSSLPVTSTVATSAFQDKAKSLGNTAAQVQQSGNASGAEAQAAGAAADSSLPSVALILSRAAQDARQAQSKQLNDMRDAVAKLNAMPSANTMAKSLATERAAMLKKILDMLKQMMVGATPAQARAMAAQLKDIAKELASMGKLLSNGSDAGMAPSVQIATGTDEVVTGGAASAAAAQATAVEAEGSAATSPVGSDMIVPAISTTSSSGTVTPSRDDDGTEDAGAQVAQADTAASDTVAPAFSSLSHNAHQAVAAYAETMRSAQGIGNKADEKAIDDSLRSALQEALKALRSLIFMLKSKLGHSNKDVNEAERQMKELARSLSESENQNLSASGMQELMQAQIAQDGGAAESAVSAVADTAGGISAEISVDDASVSAMGSVSVSA